MAEFVGEEGFEVVGFRVGAESKRSGKR